VTKRLYLTADDFGYSPAVNRAVIRAYKDGALRYASLMVDGEAAHEAAALAKANPGLGVGLHLDLCRSEPALWGLRYFFLRAHRERVEPEIARQLDKFTAFGLSPTHVDGHFNIHVHPVIFPILARRAKAAGVPRIRLPGGELSPCLAQGWDQAPVRALNAAVFGALGALLRPLADGMTVPTTFGLLRSGTMTEDYALRLLERLPEGDAELYFHPSDDPASAVTTRPTPTHQTVTELETLLSARVREALSREGIELARMPRPRAG